VTDVDTSLDELELELRRIPGVLAVGFTDEGEALVVHVLSDVAPAGAAELRRQVSLWVRANLDRPVVIEVEDVEPPAVSPERGRVRLEAVRVDEFSQSLDVHLLLGTRRTVGRAEAGSPRDAAAATLEALDRLGANLPFRIDAATAALRNGPDHAVVVVLEPGQGAHKLYGVARAHSMEEAAARATLHALNRYLSREAAFAPA
jgi:hypothetical protein